MTHRGTGSVIQVPEDRVEVWADRGFAIDEDYSSYLPAPAAETTAPADSDKSKPRKRTAAKKTAAKKAPSTPRRRSRSDDSN